MDLLKVANSVKSFQANEDFSAYAKWDETPFFLITTGSLNLINSPEPSFGSYVIESNANLVEKLETAQMLTETMKVLLFDDRTSLETPFGFCLADVQPSGEFIIVTVVAKIDVSPYMANRIMLAIKHNKWPLTEQDLRLP